MEHDQLFKDLLRRFLPDFMALFFPRQTEQLDFSRLSFLDKEAFTDVPRGKRREADLLAKVHTRKGEPELLLVHVEVEAQRRAEFLERMFQYYAVLRMRHGLPVLPIVLYVRRGTKRGTGVEVYVEELLGQRILEFQFLGVSLPSLNGPAYVDKANRLAGALAALMKPGRLGKPHLKAKCLRHVSQTQLNEAEQALLVNLVQTYLPLDPQDNAELNRLLSRDDYQEVKATMLTYSEKLLRRGEKRGEKRGEERGEIRGKRTTLLRQIELKFGELPRPLKMRLSRIRKAEEIDRLLGLVLTASSLDEMGLTGQGT